MDWRAPEDGFEQQLRILRGLQAVSAEGNETLSRFAGDMRALLRSGVETRRLLAEQVYRVPDAWLDEVVRVRLAELRRGGPSS